MVSVIIPNYNHAGFLIQRIESVLNQTYQDFEVIILDDCSTDNSKEVIENYRNHSKVSHIVYNEFNSGSTFRQWKKGVDLAKGDWIWIAESDDYCDKNFLSILLSSDILENVGVRYCQSLPVNEYQEIVGKEVPSLLPGIRKGLDFLSSNLLAMNCVPNASSVIIRKEALLNVITSDVSKFKLVGDWLVWCRLALIDNYCFVTSTKNYHRIHINTVRESSSKLGNYFSEFKLFRHILEANILNSTIGLEWKKKLLEDNKNHFFREQGLRACELIRNGQYIKSIKPLLTATINPKINFYYLKSALYWIIKRNEKVLKS